MAPGGAKSGPSRQETGTSGITERGFLPSVFLEFSPARQIRENFADGTETN